MVNGLVFPIKGERIIRQLKSRAEYWRKQYEEQLKNDNPGSPYENWSKRFEMVAGFVNPEQDYLLSVADLDWLEFNR